MTNSHCLVITTTGSKQEAQALATQMLQSHLAACVQIFPVESHYLWQGELQHDNEFALHIKTRTDNFAKLTSAITQMHSYDVPEIICLEITAGYKPYLDWVDQAASPD